MDQALPGTLSARIPLLQVGRDLYDLEIFLEKDKEYFRLIGAIHANLRLFSP